MDNNKFFDYQAKDEYRLEEIKKNRHYALYRLIFPSPVNTPFPENNTVRSSYYQPADSDSAIIVLHELEGEFYSKYFSKCLAKRGFSCLQVPMPYARTRVPKRKLKHVSNKKIDFSDIFITGFKQAVSDTRRAADWLAERHKEIGILGISMGAIIASLTAEIDGRFKSAVYILGGGDPANMLWDSKSLLVKFYKRAVQRNTTIEELREKWKVIDPINYARGNVENILMINARYDTTVPAEYSKKLWEALGKPEIRWLKADHFTSGLFTPYIRKQAADFFHRTLE
ncbi:MAG: alpha/beta hydrolase family protein [Actinomycetota bacterium]